MTDIDCSRRERLRLASPVASQLLLLILFCFFGSLGRVLAQGQLLGEIHGTVTDQQGGVLAGALITATPSEKRPPVTATTDAAGFYTLKDLMPGEYSISAVLPGFSTLVQTNVRTRAGLTLSLDLVMTLGSIGELVTVKRDAPLLESSSAASGVNISGDLQRVVPLSRQRDWADFLLVTPGVISSDTTGFPNYSLHGSSAGSHVLQVDGADMASSTANANSYIKISTESIEDVHVKTAGLEASAPLGLGAIVNVATPSGANRLAGAVTTAVQSERWNDSNVVSGTSSRVGLFQLDAALGGPIVPDRYWFFGSYRRIDKTIGLSRTEDQLSLLRTLAPGFTPFDNATKGNVYLAKVTAQPAARHQVMAFAQYDLVPNDFNQDIYAGPYLRTEQGGSGYAARLSSVWGSSFTTRMTVSYNDKAISIVGAYDDRPARNVFRSASLVSGRLVGSGVVAVLDNYPAQSVEEAADKLTIAADLTLARSNLFGSHEFQAGVYLQPRLRIRRTHVWPNNGFVVEDSLLAPGSASTLVPFHRQVYDRERVPSVFADGSDYAFYVQDAWRPTRQLTINVGARVDIISERDDIFDVHTQKSTDIGPRIGANYLVTADGRNSLRASWTRVHETPSQTAVSAGANTAGVHDSYDLDLNGSFETVLVTPGATALARDRIFNLSNWHQPYVNEWTAGYRRQLPGQVSLDVGWIQREYRDRSAGVEINGIYDESGFHGYRDESLNQIYLVTNNVWNWPVYSAFEVQVAKRGARSQLIASYTRQWRHLAGTWQPNDPGAFLQPDAFPNDKGIGTTRGSPGSASDANSLSGTQGVTSAAEWHDHAVRIGGSWSVPWNVTLAASYVFQSGIWSGPVVARLSATDPRFGPPTLQLNNGRVVSNPLATTIRFAGATRGDNQFTLPNLHMVNLRVGREFRLRRSSVFAALDVYNLTNHDATQYLLSGANQVYSANYQLGTSRQLPRSAQVSARLSF